MVVRATEARDSAREDRLLLWRTPFLFLLIFSFLWLQSALPLTTTVPPSQALRNNGRFMRLQAVKKEKREDR